MVDRREREQLEKACGTRVRPEVLLGLQWTAAIGRARASMVARLQSDVDLSEEAELRRLVGEAGRSVRDSVPRSSGLSGLRRTGQSRQRRAIQLERT